MKYFGCGTLRCIENNLIHEDRLVAGHQMDMFVLCSEMRLCACAALIKKNRAGKMNLVTIKYRNTVSWLVNV